MEKDSQGFVYSLYAVQCILRGPYGLNVSVM